MVPTKASTGLMIPHGGLLPSIAKLCTTAAGTPRSSVATASFGMVEALHGSWPPEAARISSMWNQLEVLEVELSFGV